ncbi:MAG: hypothetical protein WEB00_00900 [Dehalococcoidia bacterium]
METGVSYFSARDLRHVQSDLEEIVGHGCTYIVHCYTETDMLWNRGTIERIFRTTRDAGLGVWADPWGVAGIFSGETLSRFAADHLDAWQQLSDGRRVPVACPSHPETRGFIKRWVQVAAEAGAEVAFWDEPHLYASAWAGDFSGAWSCHCSHCAELLSQHGGGTLHEEFDAGMMAFRETVLLDFLAGVCAAGRQAGLRNALCLLPSAFERHGFPAVAEGMRSGLAGRVPADKLEQVIAPLLHFGIDDWDKAAAIPDLDIFGTDPYWFLFDVEPERFMRSYSERAIETANAHGRESQLWLQAFRVPEGREEELRMGAAVAAELGADSVAAWSYRGTESMSKIACARPQVVWGVLGEAFRTLRRA